MMFAEIWTAILAGIGGVVFYGALGGLALIGIVRVFDLLIFCATRLWERWLSA